MKKILGRIVVLAVIFIAAVLFFSSILNRNEVRNARTMTVPTLPVMYMVVEGTTVNPMEGYTEEPDAETLRSGLTLIDTDRNFSFKLLSYDNEISGVDYEVISLLDGSLVENGMVKNMSEEEGYLTADVHIETPILLNQEYTLKFSVRIGEDRTVCYYTRILQRSEVSAASYLAYAQQFYLDCLAGTLTEDEINNLEPDDSEASSSLHSVNIRSDRKQITWGSLSPQLVQAAVPVIREINETTCSISQNYMVSADNGQGGIEYYTVEEFYRMRIKQNKVVLLDFDRETTQIFDPSLPVLNGTGLNLGIVGKNISYASNAGADIAAFTVDGDLWQYNRSSCKVSCVFSFRQGAELDERTQNMEHGIRISSVSETGDVSFIVYGYMSADEHEGKTGIAVYKYSAEQNMTEELLYIPCSESYEAMEQELSVLSYVNSRQQLFLYLYNRVYQVNLEDGTVSVLLDQVDPDCLKVSDDQEILAWMDEMDYNASTGMTLMNLETETTVHIQAEAGERIRVLGSVNEDVIYGFARDSEIGTDATGNTVFAMYRICIADQEGQTEKEYSADGIYVTGISCADGLVELKRVVRNEDGSYTAIDSDHIINNPAEEGDSVSIALNVDDRAGTQSYLSFTTKGGSSSNLLSMSSQFLEKQAAQEIQLANDTDRSGLWYVYGEGKLQTICTTASEAVQQADSCMGTVLDSSSRYIWERGNYDNSSSIDPSVLNPVVLQTVLDENLIQETLGAQYEVLNLSGCSLEEMYYFIAHGSPVITLMADGTPGLILGYDIYNIWLYNQADGTTYAVAQEDAAAQIAAAGNIFLVCRELEY